MKKYFLLVAIIFATFSSINAQTEDKVATDLPASEIRLNILYLLFGSAEITYERVINDNGGVGIIANFNMDNNQYFNINYMFMPYYRLYSADNAKGLFLEGGFNFFNYRYQKNTQVDLKNITTEEIENSYGPSLSLGSKSVYNNNLTLECFVGVFRNFNHTTADEHPFFGRFGITLGKRF